MRKLSFITLALFATVQAGVQDVTNPSDLKQSGYVVAKFYAEWCGPCRMFAPVVEKLASKYSDKAKFYAINVDTHNDLSGKYGVQSLPTTLILKDGKEIERIVGGDSNALESKLKSLSDNKTEDRQAKKKAQNAVGKYTSDADLKNSEISVVKCFATWCGHCKNFAPVYEEFAGENASGDVKFYEVDADTAEGKAFAGEHKIQGFPTTIIFKNGKRVDDVVGGNVNGLKEKLEAARNMKVEEPVAKAEHKASGLVEEATCSAHLKRPGVVVVKFYADWCTWCGPYAEDFDKLAQEFSDSAKFFQVDIEKSPEIQKEFQVKELPVTLVLDSGKVLTEVFGANAEQVRSTLRALKDGSFKEQTVHAPKAKPAQMKRKPALLRRGYEGQAKKSKKNSKYKKPRKKIVEVEEDEMIDEE